MAVCFFEKAKEENMDNISLVKLPKEIYFEKDMLYDVSRYHLVKEPQLHWHEFYEIEYVVEGYAQQIVNGKVFDVSPGCITLISPVDFHTYHNIDPDAPLHIINVKFQDLFLPQSLRNDMYMQRRPKIAHLKEEQHFRFLNSLCEEFNGSDYGRDTVLIHDITKLCIMIMRRVLSVDEQQSAVDAVHSPIQEAILYVRTHFRDNISAEAVAKTVHLSPNYFSEYFKKQTGEKFSLFVLRLRIDFAANLLKISDLSVKEIAFESGFNSAAYFSNTFKAFYHMSPDRYRKIHRIDPTETV